MMNLSRKYTSRFIETIQRKEGTFLHLNLHQERMNKTFNYFFKDIPVPDLQAFLQAQKFTRAGRYRCTIRYAKTIENITSIPYQPKILKGLICKKADKLDYSFKYSDRSCFEILKKGIPPAYDIIIIKNGKITDCSYANLVFFDGTKWLTPADVLLPGTKRKKLIDNGSIIPEEICPKDLRYFSTCSLINAMLDPEEIQVKIENIII